MSNTRNVAAETIKIMAFSAAAAPNGSSRLMRTNGMHPTSNVEKSAEKNFKAANRSLTSGALKINAAVFLCLSLVEIEARRGTRIKKMMGRIESRTALIGNKRLKITDEAIKMTNIG